MSFSESRGPLLRPVLTAHCILNIGVECDLLQTPLIGVSFLVHPHPTWGNNPALALCDKQV
jgi:hypothetical protein